MLLASHDTWEPHPSDQVLIKDQPHGLLKNLMQIPMFRRENDRSFSPVKTDNAGDLHPSLAQISLLLWFLPLSTRITFVRLHREKFSLVPRPRPSIARRLTHQHSTIDSEDSTAKPSGHEGDDGRKLETCGTKSWAVRPR